MLLMGWKGQPPGSEALAKLLVEVGAEDHLAWMLDVDAFAPIEGDAGPILHDGASPVEALAHKSWRADS